MTLPHPARGVRSGQPRNVWAFYRSRGKYGLDVSRSPGRNRGMDSDEYATIGSRSTIGGFSESCETPTPNFFIMSYNKVLREIAVDNLDYVVTADSVSELEEASCEEEVNLIRTSLAIEFFGNPDEASPKNWRSSPKVSKIPSMLSMG